MGSWAVQDAKARFSEVLAVAEEQGPQIITRRGVETAVLCPIEEWRRIHQPSRPERPTAVLSTEEFLRVLRSGPQFDIPDRHAERSARRRRKA